MGGDSLIHVTTLSLEIISTFYSGDIMFLIFPVTSHEHMFNEFMGRSFS